MRPPSSSFPEAIVRLVGSEDEEDRQKAPNEFVRPPREEEDCKVAQRVCAVPNLDRGRDGDAPRDRERHAVRDPVQHPRVERRVQVHPPVGALAVGELRNWDAIVRRQLPEDRVRFKPSSRERLRRPQVLPELAKVHHRVFLGRRQLQHFLHPLFRQLIRVPLRHLPRNGPRIPAVGVEIFFLASQRQHRRCTASTLAQEWRIARPVPGVCVARNRAAHHRRR
mmetsp:Transcript_12998/g.31579  ORF Transcript_12998/g.31579 Transcript_12998/m.31579 type:complete len:223 (-) Transcript_12998:178-846(-)